MRRFAGYLNAVDDRHDVPPADVLLNRVHRAVPYLYSPEEIAARMDASSMSVQRDHGRDIYRGDLK